MYGVCAAKMLVHVGVETRPLLDRLVTWPRGLVLKQNEHM